MADPKNTANTLELPLESDGTTLHDPAVRERRRTDSLTRRGYIAFSPGVFITRLLMASVLLTIVVCVIAGRSLHESYRSYQQQAFLATQNLARSLEQDLAGLFDKVDLAISSVKDESERQLAAGIIERNVLNGFIARQLSRQSDLDSIRVTNHRGDIIYGTDVSVDAPFNAARRQVFMRLRDDPTAGLVISEPVVGQINGKWLLAFGRRVNQPDGKFAGVVYGTIALELLQKKFAALDLGRHGAVSLRDLDLGTVVRYPEPQTLGTAVGNRTFSKEWPEKLKSDPVSGTYFAVGLDDRKRALSYRRISNYPFYIIVGLFPDDYLAQWYADIWRELALVAIFLTVTVFSTWLIISAWKRREADSRRLLGLTRLALRNSEGRFRHLTEAMPQVAYTAEPDGASDYLNTRWQQYTGKALEDGLGAHWVDFVHPDDREHASARWGQSVATGEPFECEYRLRKADGAYRWHVSRALPVRDGNGEIIKWVGTSTDIDDAKRAEQKSRADDQKKDEFLATLAHELRNPLAPIRNAVQIMRLSKEPAVLEKTRTMIERQLEHLVHLVDDLFDISRITQGKLQLRKERVALAKIIQDAVETARLRIERASHKLTVSLPPQSIVVNADPTRLAQVFGNLLNNAARYTPDGGHISVTADQQAGDVLVRVKDNGIGIPPDMHARIFDMFTQADRRLDQSQGGLGIGLALVRRLVDMHGGHVEAHSAGVGQGSEFVVRLPIVAADRRKQPRAETRQLEDAELAPARRILIVDDNADNANSLAMMMRFLGHETALAYDGVEALETAETFHPDVILLDIGLPKLSGHDVARSIRARPWGKSVMLVALTGWGQDHDRRRSQEAGFDHHMVKPVEFEALRQIMVSAS